MLFLQIAILYIVYRYMHCFFDTAQVRKSTELAAYGFYFITVWLVSSQYGKSVISFAAGMVFIFCLHRFIPENRGKNWLLHFCFRE